MRSLLFWLLLTTAATAAAPEVRFLEGLRERRLYRLAEIECYQQLAASDLSDHQRAELVIQLALTHAAQALDAPSAEREPHWEKATGVCEEYLAHHSEVPRALLVNLQRALLDISRGEIEQLEAIGTAQEPRRLARANQHFRQAIRRLETVREAVDAGRNGLRPELLAEGGFGEHELASLAGNVALETARALSRQAACFPQESADRDDALLRALALLEPLAAKMPADDFVWRSRLELLACLRQLGRLPAAQQQLEAWVAAMPPETFQEALLAERLRLLLAAERPGEALKLAEQNPATSTADADLARLEAFVAAWQQQPQESLTQTINALLNQIRQRHGPAATRRGEALVGRVFADSPHASNPQSLVHAAEHLFHAGRLDEAVAAYDRATAAFAEADNAEGSFSAALTAATIEKTRGALPSAAERYRQLALQQPQHAQAAAAHQAAILVLADHLRAEPTMADGKGMALYGELLAEHLAHWNDSPTADDARLWQAQMLISQAKFTEALAPLAAISTASPHAGQAVEMASDLYARLLEPLPRESTAARDLLVQATAHLQPLVLGKGGRWPQTWTPLERAAALALARLHLQHGPQGHEYAQRMLLAALRGTPVPEPEWQTDAASLLIVALVRGGQTGEALPWLQQVSDHRASDALALLDALLAELESVPTAQQSALAGVLLSAVDAIAVQAKDDAELQSLLVRYRAAALAGLRRDQEALALYAELAPQRPRDGAVQEEYASLLARSDSTAVREQALRQWHAVERASRQGSPRWFGARLARIALLQKLDRRDEATKLLALTRLVYPDLGGDELRKRFEALE